MWHHVLGWTFGITLPTCLFALKLSIDPPNLTHPRAPIENESKIKRSGDCEINDGSSLSNFDDGGFLPPKSNPPNPIDEGIQIW